MKPHDPVLTAHEVAAELRVHYATVLRRVRAGDLPAAKRGGHFYIRRSAVDRFLDPST